ncbi:hypothetical protein BX257_0652 [Streptomyces sp. 3212.3]|jgi:hypothetical protein|nr:hypothetical protein BX257_0652 [Streptomyces sp. 3212.3]
MSGLYGREFPHAHRSPVRERTDRPAAAAALDHSGPPNAPGEAGATIVPDTSAVGGGTR